MPAPKILSNYSPAFKRKSLAVYGNCQPNNTSALNNAKNQANNQLTSPDAPKSLESICSPTRSDYSFDFVSSSGSPDSNVPASKARLNGQRKNGRSEYDDSDNDSAVSSSQSSISRGFSPPMSPVPSDRSTISSERSYLSESHYQRPQLILEACGKSNGASILSEKSPFGSSSPRCNVPAERSYTMSPPEKTPPSFKPIQQQQQQQPSETIRSSHIPQRQPLKRSSSTETNSSNSGSSTLTSGSQASAESLSRRVLKPQSVEAINRKNILASARCRSGRDLNGSPLIQRKFADEEEAAAAAVQKVNGGFVSAHRLTNGSADCTKPRIKIAYIEITDNVLALEGDKFANQTKVEDEEEEQDDEEEEDDGDEEEDEDREQEEEEDEDEEKEQQQQQQHQHQYRQQYQYQQQKQQQQQYQQQPRLPPKRSIIPQAKNVPLRKCHIPCTLFACLIACPRVNSSCLIVRWAAASSRAPKSSEMAESPSDMKSWMRAEMRAMTETSSDRTSSYDARKKSSVCDKEASRSAFRSKSTLTLNELRSPPTLGSRSRSIDAEGGGDLIGSIKPKARSGIAMKKTADNHNDLLTVLTTKSRSR
jgi:hypothetical protein